MLRTLTVLLGLFICLNIKAQIIDNHIFSLHGDFSDWVVMSDSELGDRIVYAKEVSGRKVRYIAGLIHKNGMPTVLFQSKEFDMSKMTPKINFEAFEAKSGIPSTVDYTNPEIPMPSKVSESVMSVPGRYMLTKFELLQDNEPANNFSYLFLHGKGHLTMQSLTFEGEAALDFPKFEKIRKGLKFKKELPFELGGTPATQTKTTQPISTVDQPAKKSKKKRNPLGIIISLCVVVFGLLLAFNGRRRQDEGA